MAESSKPHSNNSISRWLVIIIVLIITYQFVIGVFIRKSCDDEALSSAIDSITPILYSDPDERGFVQEIYRSMAYYKCLNRYLLFDVGTKNVLY